MSHATEQSADQPGFISRQVREAQRFFLNLRPADHAGLTVACGGWEQCADDYEIHRSGFPFLSLEYVARGEGRVTLDGRSYALLPGTVFAYDASVPHDIDAAPGSGLVKYFVDFSGRRGRTLLSKAGVPPGGIAQVSPAHDAEMLFEQLVHNGCDNSRFTSDICRALLECLLLKIAETRIPYGSASSGAFITYRQCRHYLEQHFLTLQSMRELARCCHLDKAYLCRLFKRYDRQSPYQLLVRLKMNWAAAQLQNPDRLVKQVARELGYDYAGHFSRTFKRVYGVSPQRFRGPRGR